MGGSDMFEVWLKQELRRAVETAAGPRPRAWQALYRSAARRDRPGLLARITGRGIAFLTASALALGGGGVALAAATTGVDPVSWGQAVVQVVERCQDGSCGVPAGSQGRPDRTGPPASGRPRAESPASGGGGTPVRTPPGQGHPVAVFDPTDPTAGPAGKPVPSPAHPSAPGHARPTPVRPSPGHPAGPAPRGPHKPDQPKPTVLPAAPTGPVKT